jgi:hypothetical protein
MYYVSNLFWEIVRLVGFYYKNISRCTVLWMSIYQDARSSECQNRNETYFMPLKKHFFFKYSSLQDNSKGQKASK